MAPPRFTPEQREAAFWAKVDKSGDCWLWTGSSSPGRYGFVARSAGTPTKLAHRVAWESAFGDIPEGMTIDHVCRVKLCCNPEHLEVVTHAENVRRREFARREAAGLYCNNGHLWSENERKVKGRGPAKDGPSIARGCATCMNESQARSVARKKAALALE